jgi:hypothetical protein
MLAPVFDRFARKSPISVMARGIVERILNPEQLDEWFDRTARRQYTETLLFSTVFEIMSTVVNGVRPSVNATYQALKEEVGVSVASVYNKLNCLETGTSEKLVRYAAGEIGPVIQMLGGRREPLVRGLRTRILDGNCIEATEHRIKELRAIASGALPGKTLVVYEYESRIPVNVFACEDGHAQERSLLGRVLECVEKGELWIGDRNFCVVSFLCGIAERGGHFIIRQHANLPWKSTGPEKYRGATETGKVYEQPIEIVDESGGRHAFRRVRVELKEATRDGDMEIRLISSLGQKTASAKRIARIYKKRWTVETAFQELAEHLNSEINALGYPPAAIFAFCVALVSYMAMATIKAALASVHGTEKIEKELSGYYVADEISGTYRGMSIAISMEEWAAFGEMSRSEFVEQLRDLAGAVKLGAFKKHPRGPKKPQPERIKDPKTPHVSTAKILKQRKGK